jgi:putative ABC transport system permease protein
MLKNYIITALRHFRKNKFFSFINIAGLSLSMAVCLLLIMIIKDANEYDKFHPDSERVYRINTEALRKDESRIFKPGEWIEGRIVNMPI